MKLITSVDLIESTVEHIFTKQLPYEVSTLITSDSLLTINESDRMMKESKGGEDNATLPSSNISNGQIKLTETLNGTSPRSQPLNVKKSPLSFDVTVKKVTIPPQWEKLSLSSSSESLGLNREDAANGIPVDSMYDTESDIILSEEEIERTNSDSLSFDFVEDSEKFGLSDSEVDKLLKDVDAKEKPDSKSTKSNEGNKNGIQHEIEEPSNETDRASTIEGTTGKTANLADMILSNFEEKLNSGYEITFNCINPKKTNDITSEGCSEAAKSNDNTAEENSVSNSCESIVPQTGHSIDNQKELLEKVESIPECSSGIQKVLQGNVNVVEHESKEKNSNNTGSEAKSVMEELVLQHNNESEQNKEGILSNIVSEPEQDNKSNSLETTNESSHCSNILVSNNDQDNIVTKLDNSLHKEFSKRENTTEYTSKDIGNDSSKPIKESNLNESTNNAEMYSALDLSDVSDIEMQDDDTQSSATSIKTKINISQTENKSYNSHTKEITTALVVVNNLIQSSNNFETPDKKKDEIKSVSSSLQNKIIESPDNKCDDVVECMDQRPEKMEITESALPKLECSENNQIKIKDTNECPSVHLVNNNESKNVPTPNAIDSVDNENSLVERDFALDNKEDDRGVRKRASSLEDDDVRIIKKTKVEDSESSESVSQCGKMSPRPIENIKQSSEKVEIKESSDKTIKIGKEESDSCERNNVTDQGDCSAEQKKEDKELIKGYEKIFSGCKRIREPTNIIEVKKVRFTPEMEKHLSILNKAEKCQNSVKINTAKVRQTNESSAKGDVKEMELKRPAKDEKFVEKSTEKLSVDEKYCSKKGLVSDVQLESMDNSAADVVGQSNDSGCKLERKSNELQNEVIIDICEKSDKKNINEKLESVDTNQKLENVGTGTELEVKDTRQKLEMESKDMSEKLEDSDLGENFEGMDKNVKLKSVDKSEHSGSEDKSEHSESEDKSVKLLEITDRNAESMNKSEKLVSADTNEKLESMIVSEKLKNEDMSEKLRTTDPNGKLENTSMSEKLESADMNEKSESADMSEKLQSADISEILQSTGVSEKLRSEVTRGETQNSEKFESASTTEKVESKESDKKCEIMDIDEKSQSTDSVKSDTASVSEKLEKKDDSDKLESEQLNSNEKEEESDKSSSDKMLTSQDSGSSVPPKCPKSNLDLAIERVALGLTDDDKPDVSEKPDEPKKLNPMPFMRDLRENLLRKLSRNELEELVVQKLCEVVTERSALGDMRQRNQTQEQMLEHWRKKAQQLQKQLKDMEMVLKRYIGDARTRKERPIPVKITRSVGLQVHMGPMNPGMLRNRPAGSNEPARNQGQVRRRANRVSSPVTGTTPQPQSQPQQQQQQQQQNQQQQSTPQQQQRQNTQVTGTPTSNPLTVQKVVTPGFAKITTPSTTPQAIAPRPTVTTQPAVQSQVNRMQKIAPAPSPVKSVARAIPSLTITNTTGSSTSTISTVNNTAVNTANNLRVASAVQLNNRQPVKQTSPYNTPNKSGDHKIIDLTDEEDRAKASNLRPINPAPSTVANSMTIATGVPISSNTSIQTGSIRVVQPHQLTGTTTTTLLASSAPTSANSRLAYFVPSTGVSGPQRQVLIASSAQQVRPSVMTVSNRQNQFSTLVLKNGTVVPIQQASGTQPVNTTILRPGPTMQPGQLQQVLNPTRSGPQIRVAPSLVTTVGRMPAPTVTNVPILANKHPAPLPNPPLYQPNNVNWKCPPPKPELKISKGANKHQQGIVLSWNMTLTPDNEEIASYQLYAYQEGSAQPSTTLWKKVGDVKALPLPMACTLTQFMEGHKYHFAVRAVDVHMRVGPFSTPGNIVLTRK